ncbi:MAG: nucleotidyltransferase [Armatimonadetes bacterium]|nr:nucleotidyltransferase [Armatimonadota bacterium]
MRGVRELAERKLCRPPAWLPEAIQYETQMGSVAYGVSSDTSDVDLYGFCIPPRQVVFPHLAGHIPGFGLTPPERFEQYQQHHIRDPSELGGHGRSYDVAIFSIVKYFQLCLENNPNMVDSLFTPHTCVLTSTAVGQKVRENRRLFLHRGCWVKFKGYAYSQLHKMAIKTPEPGSKRDALVQEHGYDVKFAYHTVRLLLEVEQLLLEGDLDLQRHREQLKAIRRGEWTEPQIREWAAAKEADLERAYANSVLPAAPNETALRNLLLDCLELHYGDLKGAVAAPGAAEAALRQIEEISRRALAALDDS